MRLLIDSTVLISAEQISAERHHQRPEELLEALVDRWGDRTLAISVMSAAELFHGCWRADTPTRRHAAPVERSSSRRCSRWCPSSR